MQSDKCISTSSPATAKNQLTINDLDDDSLAVIFNKLPYIDRARVENVCQRWCDVVKPNWCTYSKRLRIGEDTGDFLPSYDNTTEKENILEMILQQSGPYLEEITFKRSIPFCREFSMGTIKWIAEFCPNLKRLYTGSLMLNDDDWLACNNLEAFSFSSAQQKDGKLGGLFRRNKRLRRLHISFNFRLTASDFDHLDPGQLDFLQIEYCHCFEFTAEVVHKLSESLVELRYSTIQCSTPPNLEHLGKLKKLRSLDLAVRMESLKIEFIADLVENCRKLECLFLAISVDHTYDLIVYAPLFDLPYLRRLVIILGDEDEMPCEERDRLLQRAAHLEFFVIDTCAKCSHEEISFRFCDRHRRG